MSCLSTWVYYYLITVVIIVLVDVIILLWGNNKFRYYACYFGYIATTSAFGLLYLPLLPFLRIGNNSNIYFTTIPAQILSMVLGIKWEIRGLEHLNKNRPAIVTATHQTMFDILGLFIIGSALRNIVAVARKALFYVWPLGPLFWLSGSVVFIDRKTKDHTTNKEKLSNVICRVKKNKMKMIFFPEGTRNLNGKNLLPFRKGAFRLAIESQLPILPLVFSPYKIIDPEKKLFKKGKVIISILPPIVTQGTSMLDLDRIVDQTQKAMEAEFQRLKSELETVEPTPISSR